MINQIILGLSAGAMYSIVALGLVMIYKVSGVMNFAYGNMGMFVTYIVWWLISKNIGNIYIGIFVGVFLGAIFGIIVERFGLRPIRHLSHSSMLIVTFGVLMILEGLAVQIWGTTYKAFPELISGNPFILRGSFGIAVFTRQDILIFTLLAIIGTSVFLFTKFTKFGIALRAVSENEMVAEYMGINTGMVFAFAWGFGTAMSFLAGILVAPKTSVSPSMLIGYQLQGFTAAVLGGFDSFAGAIFGGLILGVIEKLVGNYISEGLKSTFSLIVIIIVLMFFPGGLFGKQQRRRV